MSEALQRIESAPPAVVQDPMVLLTMAVERGADVGTLERLAALRDKFKAEQARNAFFDSLAAFQAELPPIIRKRAGHENRYNYAPLEQIVREVTPLLNKHGFSHQEDGVVTDGWVEAIVAVTHRAGHREEKRFKVPSQTNAGMSPQQKYGAAMTYATRYAFCAAFGIRTTDKDTDCPPAGESVTALQKKLWETLASIRGPESKWTTANAWLERHGLIAAGKKVIHLSATELGELIDKAGILLAEMEQSS